MANSNEQLKITNKQIAKVIDKLAEDVNFEEVKEEKTEEIPLLGAKKEKKKRKKIFRDFASLVDTQDKTKKYSKQKKKGKTQGIKSYSDEDREETLSRFDELREKVRTYAQELNSLKTEKERKSFSFKNRKLINEYNSLGRTLDTMGALPKSYKETPKKHTPLNKNKIKKFSNRITEIFEDYSVDKSFPENYFDDLSKKQLLSEIKRFRKNNDNRNLKIVERKLREWYTRNDDPKFRELVEIQNTARENFSKIKKEHKKNSPEYKKALRERKDAEKNLQDHKEKYRNKKVEKSEKEIEKNEQKENKAESVVHAIDAAAAKLETAKGDSEILNEISESEYFADESKLNKQIELVGEHVDFLDAEIGAMDEIIQILEELKAKRAKEEQVKRVDEKEPENIPLVEYEKVKTGDKDYKRAVVLKGLNIEDADFEKINGGEKIQEQEIAKVEKRRKNALECKPINSDKAKFYKVIRYETLEEGTLEKYEIKADTSDDFYNQINAKYDAEIQVIKDKYKSKKKTEEITGDTGLVLDKSPQKPDVIVDKYKAEISVARMLNKDYSAENFNRIEKEINDGRFSDEEKVLLITALNNSKIDNLNFEKIIQNAKDDVKKTIGDHFGNKEKNIQNKHIEELEKRMEKTNKKAMDAAERIANKYGNEKTKKYVEDVKKEIERDDLEKQVKEIKLEIQSLNKQWYQELLKNAKPSHKQTKETPIKALYDGYVSRKLFNAAYDGDTSNNPFAFSNVNELSKKELEEFKSVIDQKHGVDYSKFHFRQRVQTRGQIERRGGYGFSEIKDQVKDYYNYFPGVKEINRKYNVEINKLKEKLSSLENNK